MLFVFSLFRFLIVIYRRRLAAIITFTLFIYITFLIFFNINYAFVIILIVFLITYYYEKFNQILFFVLLSAVLISVIFIYSNISIANKINLLIFVIAYNLTAFLYFKKNLKIRNELSFNDTLLNSLYEEINEGLMIVNIRRRVVIQCNSRFAEIFEAPDKDKLIGKNGFLFVAEVINEYLETETFLENTWIKSFLLTSYSGKKFWGEITITPISGENANNAILKVSDITEKRQQEEIIQKLSIALKQNPGIILIFNKDGIIEYVNQKYTEITGYSYKEIVGKKIFNLGFQTNEPFKNILKKLKTLNKWNGEIQTFSKSGISIISRLSISTAIESQGHAERYIAVAVDITQQKNAELAASIAQQKNKAILEAIPDMMFTLDKNGIFTDFKIDNSIKFLIPVDKIIGSNLSEIGLLPEALDLAIISLNKIINKESQIEIFEYNVDIKEVRGYYETRMIALGRDEVLCIIRNITARKIAEQKFKENELNYKNLVEFSPNGILLHQDEEIIYANITALKTLGLKSLSDIGTLTISDMVMPEELDFVRHRFKQVFEGIDVPFVEMHIKRPSDQQLIEIESKPTIIEYNNQKVIQVVFRDISVEKKLLQEKQRVQQAEEVNLELKTEMLERKEAEIRLKKSLLEKEVLLKEVHHRVKNNMQIISSILNLQSSNINDPGIKRLFEESQDRIKSMALVHENLYRTKDFANIDFDSYITSLIENMYRSYDVDSRRITYDLDLDKVQLNIDLAIPCGLIINELISNSIKHAFGSSNKGTIFVSLKRIGEQIILSVGDNGKGIDKNVNIYETQSLGFQLVTALVQQIEGNILVETLAGTKFIITFTL